MVQEIEKLEELEKQTGLLNRLTQLVLLAETKKPELAEAIWSNRVSCFNRYSGKIQLKMMAFVCTGDMYKKYGDLYAKDLEWPTAFNHEAVQKAWGDELVRVTKELWGFSYPDSVECFEKPISVGLDELMIPLVIKVQRVVEYAVSGRKWHLLRFLKLIVHSYEKK